MVDKRKISHWWAEYPMTYGVEHGSTIYREGKDEKKLELGSKEALEKADRQLFEWNRPLHNSSTGPFGKIFPYKEYQNRQILEIGCGIGCMAMLWAKSGAKVTATDLNPTAVDITEKRFQHYGLNGTFQQEDANALSFQYATFDYVFSWGVLHHSPNLERSISELFRVLKPGGEFGVMLYHRNSLFHWYHTIFVEGILHGELRFLNQLQLTSRYGDGYRQEGNPYTWPVSKKEIKKIFTPYTKVLNTRVLGTELDSTLKLMLPGLYYIVPRIVKKAWARRFGWSLWISGKKDS